MACTATGRATPHKNKKGRATVDGAPAKEAWRRTQIRPPPRYRYQYIQARNATPWFGDAVKPSRLSISKLKFVVESARNRIPTR